MASGSCWEIPHFAVTHLSDVPANAFLICFDSWIYSITVNLHKTAFTFEAWNPAPCCLGSGHSILAAELIVSCSLSGKNWAHLHQHRGTTHTEGFRICTTGEWKSPSKINLRAVGDHQCAPAASWCRGFSTPRTWEEMNKSFSLYFFHHNLDMPYKFVHYAFFRPLIFIAS